MDIIRYLLEEVRGKRLSREDALDLFRQFENAAPQNAPDVLHPLLQKNTSCLEGPRFSSVFTGDEFYLKDHVINGVKILPGVCYLEMAHEAIKRSDGLSDGANSVMTLKHVAWSQPIVVAGHKDVHVALYSTDNGEIEFEIYSVEQNLDECPSENVVVHAQGRAARLSIAPQAEQLDLPALRMRCDRSIEITECYAKFGAMGLDYGPANRGLTSVQVGKNDAGQGFVLAQVQLPGCVADSQDQYVLHPSMLDSALQASIGLSLQDEYRVLSASGAGVPLLPLLPFALERLEIVDRCPAVAIVYVRPSEARVVSVFSPMTTGNAGKIQKLDIDICDEAGRVCVRLKGFTSRMLVGDDGQAVRQPLNAMEDNVQEAQTLLLTPRWEVKALTEVTPLTEFGERWVVLDSIYKECISDLSARYPEMQWTSLQDPDNQRASEAKAVSVALQIFTRVQAILQGKPKRTVLLQIVVSTDAEQGVMVAALSGLFKSARQENAKFVGQVISLPGAARTEEIARAVKDNANEAANGDMEIRYINGLREVMGLHELRPSATAVSCPSMPWKNDGVYLITGGAGGLGMIVAREIASQVRNTKIILTGRSKLSEAKQKQIESLGKAYLGLHIDYRIVDVSDANSVTMCIHSLLEQYGAINGIVHSAGVIHDNFFIKKTVAELQQVLAPKVSGIVHLDGATQEIELDFLMVFSSVAGVLGNAGQADYALANSFMDRYAAQRNEWAKQGKRHGKTLSINWPLWADGGMHIDAGSLKQRQHLGVDRLSTSLGIEALYSAWRSNEVQVMVLAGDVARIRESVLHRQHGVSAIAMPLEAESKEPREEPSSIDKPSLLEKVQSAIIHEISQQLKVKTEEIDVDAEFSEFGFDSIGLTSFGNALHQSYGLELSPTIFFEYPTTKRFSEYLVEEHALSLAKTLGVRTASRVERLAPLSNRSTHAHLSAIGSSRRRYRPVRIAATELSSDQFPQHDPIAIIGMSGCFPGANDIAAFWENLRGGKDSITQIPLARWDWQAVYGDPAHEANKTNIKWGGFIEGVDEFDPLFFNISPKEAELMDPQQRLLMTHTWKAIEDAGYSAQSLSGSKTGIFVGTASSGYSELLAQANIPVEGYSSTGMVSSVGPNRMSYLLNVHGPSEPIETACSSSLVAIHRAVRAMQSGDCEMALVGGINTIVTPWAHISFSKAGMLCEDGRCKTFSKAANGYVRGEGVGMLFLKRLSKAQRDGDHIYGLIKGSSENHGGRANSLTAPNPKAQAELIKAAYREAQIDPRTVTYIETHGTGTPLGDPIEINGLKSAFTELYASTGEPSVIEGSCGLGSVKTNIGHLELAAGVAGVIKVLLQLQHQTLVKTLHCEETNPYIQLQDSPFYIVKETQAWSRQQDREGREVPRRAGVSSFGFGGVNAHVILEEYPSSHHERQAGITPEHPALIVLSAKNEERLQEQVKQLLAELQRQSYTEDDLIDLAYTLQVGREALDHRLALTAATLEQLKQKLSAYLGNAVRGESNECYRGEVKKHKESLSIFNTDAVLQQAIVTWIGQGQYTKLLDLWSKGLRFDWATLYSASSVYARCRPKRMSLPTYPFAKERYWVDTLCLPTVKNPPSSIESHSQEQSSRAIDTEDPEEIVGEQRSASKASVEQLLFTEEWQAAALQAVEVNAATAGVRRVLVFLSDRNLQRRLLAVLARLDSQLHVVLIEKTTPDAYAEDAGENVAVSAPRYAANPASAESYGEVLRRISDEQGQFDAVWYLRPIESSICLEDHEPLVYLIQGLARAGIRETKVVLAGEYRSTLQRCHLESWIGYASSLQRVLPGVQVAVIQEEKQEQYDALSDVPSGIEEWAQRLWNECRAEKFASALYKQAHRYALRIKPLLPNLALEPALRHGGSYLITGGMGALGYVFAEYLARRYAANLILIGRSALDDESQARLQSLHAFGSSAMYVAADVGDREQLRAAIEQGRERFGELHGVIHAAGIESDASLLTKDWRSIDAVLTPKVKGTLLLTELLMDRALDFVCYFSSSAAILGDFGSCDYAVGNRFQLAYANYTNTKAFALCWPFWANGGMGRKADAAHLYLKASGQCALDAAKGVELFELLLAHHKANKLHHGLVITGEADRVHRMLGLSPPAIDVSPTPPLQSLRRFELQGLTIEQSVLRELQMTASELLKISREKLDTHENFAEFGFDSISLATFAKRLSEHYGVEVLPSLFFSYTTLSTLAKYFIAEHADAVQKIYGARAALSAHNATHRDVGYFGEGHSPLPTAAANAAKEVHAANGTEVPEPIAIIGMSGRFPGARNVDELWEILVAGKESVTEIPIERFDWRAFYSKSSADRKIEPSLDSVANSKWLGALPGVDEFDPLFFEISPREAERMDPRQRLLLQESFNALEDAGYCVDQLSSKKVGVFVGVEQGDYQLIADDQNSGWAITANHDAILAARLSYFLNLRGPAMAINTACSSGLVAAHQACMSLRAGECDIAIAAGVNLILTPQMYVAMSQAGMLSPDGKCYAFDRRANGMVPGEAVVAVVLKRLSQAQANGDQIVAVIRGSGINYDGKTNGLTAPSGVAQTELIQEVYTRAQIRQTDIDYIVAHGTGTRLGDPVEIGALKDAFKELHPEHPFCALTSTKTNLGHTFAASGLVNLVSLVQALKHETIPASLHCEHLSDYIDWKRSPFYVNTSSKPWPRKPGKTRLGAVSAFGMSGTNAHMVVESYEREPRSNFFDGASQCYLLALSAKTQDALRQRARDLADILKDERRDWAPTNLAALSYTLLCHRQHFNYRCALTIASREQAIAQLQLIGGGEKLPVVPSGQVPREFIEQPMLLEYAEDLLKKLCLMQDDPIRYTQALASLGELYCQGYRLQWQRLYGEQPLRPISLPAYPFSRERYWIGAAQRRSSGRQINGSIENDERAAATMGRIAITKYVPQTEVSQSRSENDSDSGAPIYATFVKQTVCEILGVDYGRINTVVPLADYGMDSIAAVRLSRKLGENFPQLALPVDLPLPNLSIETLTRLLQQCQAQLPAEVNDWPRTQVQKDPVVSVATEELASRIASSIAEDSDLSIAGENSRYDLRAVRCIKSSPEPTARLLIFYCLGFGEESYRWITKLPDTIEVWTVGTTSIADWDDLIAEFTEQLRGLFDKPIVAWGHSMGANVAFEVLANLERVHALVAKAVVLSSASAPRVFARTKYTAPFYEIESNMTEREIERRLTDNHLIIPRSSGLPLISPAGLRNDIELIKKYRYDGSKRLSAHLILIQANNDVVVKDPSVVTCWEEVASRSCRYEEIEGTHLFFMNPPRRFISLLTEACEQRAESGSGSIAGVYELREMFSGTEDMHLYPLGSDACGYIIYSTEGKMAAHLWHRRRQENSNRQHSPAEAAFTYIAYAGNYRQRASIMDHDIAVSTAPQLEDRTVRRYLDRHADDIVLSTSPLVMQGGKQEGTVGYQQLRWNRLPVVVEEAALPIAGCWSLRSLVGGAKKLTFGDCKGQCIVTADGFISVLISAAKRPEFAFKNAALATDNELLLALSTVLSWLGRVDGALKPAINATTLVSQAPFLVAAVQVAVECADGILRITWSEANADDAPTAMCSEWSRTTTSQIQAATCVDASYAVPELS